MATQSSFASSSHIQDFIFVRELSEVYLLLDHISGRWDKTFPGENPAVAAGPADHISIEDICKIGWPTHGTQLEDAKQAATLLRAKDKLNEAAKPATGGTIAFTLMVVGEECPGSAPQDRRRADDSGPPANGNNGRNGRFPEPPTRISLARNAFPGLIGTAISFRRWINIILWGLFLMLLFTSVLSWYVGAGNAILTHLDALHAQEKELTKKFAFFELSSARPDGLITAAPQKNSCPPQAANAGGATRPADPCGKSQTDLMEKVCSGLSDLGMSGARMVEAGQLCEEYVAKKREHNAMGATLDRWLPSWLHAHAESSHQAVTMLAKHGPIGIVSLPGVEGRDGHADDEEFSRVLTQVLVGAILPFLYGFLGAGAAVVRDLWQKMRQSTLAPRDLTLALGNLALGAVIGACIGLFMPTGGTAPGDNALGGFILTASAMSFIAGFGVEGVFLALESVVQRLFNTQDRKNPTKNDRSAT